MASFTFYEPFYSQIERLLNDSVVSKQGHTAGSNDATVARSFKPRWDLHEDAEKNLVTVTFEFPGLSREDVQLELLDAKLSVSAQTKKPEYEESGYILRERLYGKFACTLQLPHGLQVFVKRICSS
jgi:HSP20 family protein